MMGVVVVVVVVMVDWYGRQFSTQVIE